MPMVLLCKVTEPLRAKILPQSSVAPVGIVMLVSATIFPSKSVLVPRVAELPTCQNKPLFAFEAWFIMETSEPDAVVRVLPI